MSPAAPRKSSAPRRAAAPRKTAAPRKPSAFDAVYAVVRRIPRGRVMTYGQISEYLGRRLSAQAVGWALHACPDDVPWQRVVNAAGECSTDRLGRHPGLQRALLVKEGVRFDAAGRIDLEAHRWKPRARRS